MGNKKIKISKSSSTRMKARMRQLIRSRKRLILVRQILIDHSYASYLNERETHTPNNESQGSEVLLSSILNAYQSIMSSRLSSDTAEVEINSDTFQCGGLNLYNDSNVISSNSNNNKARQTLCSIENSIPDKEIIIEWIAPDDTFESASMDASHCNSNNISNNPKSKQAVFNTRDPFEKNNVITSNNNVQNKQNQEPSAAIRKKSKDFMKKNSEEMCSLCTAKSLSNENSALDTHLAKMITDLSGVDVLNYNTSPIACANCFKIVLKVWDFKRQILEAEEHFKEKNRQMLAHSDNFNSEFEYINCNDESTNENWDETDEEDEFIKYNFVKATPGSELELDLDKDANKITLIPIEGISENSCAIEKCETDMLRCITCNDFIMRKYVYSHWCLQTKYQDSKNSKEATSYICELCGKKYTLLSSFKRHEVSHGVKKHVCNICGEAFHHAGNLRRHLRIHTGSKPFACSYCNRHFTVRWNLIQHERMHTNSLPYKCKLCSTAFRHNVSLKNHIRRSHTADEIARKWSGESSTEQPAGSSIDNNEENLQDTDEVVVNELCIDN